MAAVDMTPEVLVEGVRRRSARHIARLIRDVDDERPEAAAALDGLFPHTGRAWTVGVTGVPGAGKSTLCDALIAGWRRRGLTVGVIAIDPSSPFTGGAILGDRVRMQRHATDDGVFLHSLATRGHLGGLSRAATSAAHILDAAGFDRVLIETVGVGQDEVDIVRTADTTVVVLVPGLGDDVQSIKAGIMEIADIFCVNKADRPDTDQLVRQVRQLRALADAPGRETPVVRTVATAGDGVEELVDHIEADCTGTSGSAELQSRRQRRLREEVSIEIAASLRAVARERASELGLDEVFKRQLSPRSLAARVVESMLGGDGPPRSRAMSPAADVDSTAADNGAGRES